MTTTREAIRKQWVTTVTAIPGVKGDAGMRITTMHKDRDTDRVIPEGGDLSSFVRNSPLCWAHDYQQIPIGTVTDLEVLPQRAVDAQWRWLKNDPFADRVRNAWDQGVVRAASIGFISHERRPNEYGGMDHLRWELLEVSLCPVGANPYAVRALKSLGLLGNATDTRASRCPRCLSEPCVCSQVVKWLGDRGSAERYEVDADEVRQAVDRLRPWLPYYVDVAVREMRPDIAMWIKRAALLANPQEVVLEVLGPDDFEIDDGMLRDAVRAALASGLREVVGAEVRAAVNRKRGRIDG